MARIKIPQKFSEVIPGLVRGGSNTIEIGERKYAVGGPSEYKLGWTCHTDEGAAVRRYGKLRGAGYEDVVILDINGDEASELMAAYHGG